MKITLTNMVLEEHWNKMQKISGNVPKALRAYGKFLIEIQNDRESGEEIIEK